MRFERCLIKTLKVAREGQRLELADCMIGTLELPRDGIEHLRIKGGTIRRIECPPPGGKNPFGGSVTFTDVLFPTSRRRSSLYGGAQGYRNMRAHMEALQNGPMANLFRALELESEREDERGLTWAVSWLHGTFAGYGTRPGRALAGALLLYVAAALGVWGLDGGGIAVGDAVGWRLALFGDEWRAAAARSALLPLQSIFNPFGVFGSRGPVAAGSGVAQLALSVAGMAIDAFLIMTVTALRRRFKLA